MRDVGSDALLIHRRTVDLKPDLIKVRMVYEDGNIEVIMIGITRRTVADGFAVFVRSFLFIPGLVHLGLAAGDCREGDDVRILIAPVFGSGSDQELAMIFICKDLGPFTDGTGNLECGDFLFVFFPLLQLFFYGFHSTVAPLTEERRQLRGTFLTAVSIFQLPVSAEFDLVSADRTVFFIK